MEKAKWTRPQHTSPHYIAVPPGATILELIQNRSMSAQELADRMGLSDEQFHQLIQGEWLLTPVLAETLKRVLGPPARVSGWVWKRPSEVI